MNGRADEDEASFAIARDGARRPPLGAAAPTAGGADLGAFVPGPRAALEATGSGPLDGLTFGVKDLIDVAGAVTGAGNPDWAATRTPAARSAPAVEKLLAAGARLAGKTITDELAFSLEGANAHHGTPLNPRASDRLPGGSSSGSASAVAGGAVDFALGTDTGGSVRVPASFCGLFGIRPSHGCIPLDGVVPFAPSYDTIGWFARSADMLRQVGAVLLPDASGAALTRIFLAQDAFALADPVVAAALLRELPNRLRAPTATRVFDGAAADWLEAYRVLQGHEIWLSLGAWIDRAQPRFGSSIAARFADAAAISADDVARWQPLRVAIRERLAALLGTDGLLILPTSPSVAPLRTIPPAELGPFYRAALTLGSIAGHAGLPQVTIPAGLIENAPIGLSLIGPRGADRALLALVAHIVEEHHAANG